MKKITRLRRGLFLYPNLSKADYYAYFRFVYDSFQKAGLENHWTNTEGYIILYLPQRPVID